MLALSSLSAAQNPWVNRRKNKDKDAPVAADPAAGDTDFSKLNDMVKNLQQAGAAGGAGQCTNQAQEPSIRPTEF